MINGERIRITDWITDTLGRVEVVDAYTGEFEDAARVSIWLHLLAATPAPLPRASSHNTPLQAELRFMLTPLGGTTKQRDKALSDLLFSALEGDAIELESLPLSSSDWLALGIAPRAALVTRTHVRKARPQRDAPPVREVILNARSLPPNQA